MQPNKRERQLYGNQVIVTTREDDCSIYRIEDEDGIAVMTRYEVFPGIALVYNDVHRQELSIENNKESRLGLKNIFEINHCKEGRIEFEAASGAYLYIKKGDLAINNKTGVSHESYFPLSHYHGVTIEISLSESPQNLSEILADADVDLHTLKERFCSEDSCVVLREKEQFEHLFSELYQVPERIRKGYYKVKVLEILLFLSEVNVENEVQKNQYYNKALVATIKDIRNDMVSHIDEKMTLEQLAQKYQVSMTNMKKCFHEVYGSSMYAYMKKYRMEEAAKLLKGTDHDIGRIASMVGYDNASKFTSSFKQIIGINPSAYRRETKSSFL